MHVPRLTAGGVNISNGGPLYSITFAHLKTVFISLSVKRTTASSLHLVNVCCQLRCFVFGLRLERDD